MTRHDNRGGRRGLGRGLPCTVVAFAVCAVLASAAPLRARGDEILPLPTVDEIRPLPPVDEIVPPPPGEDPVPLPPVDEPSAGAPLADAPAAPSWLGFPTEWPDWAPTGDWILPTGSQTYVLAGAVAFQRDNQVANVPLVNDSLTNTTLLSAGDLNSPTAYGVRAFVGMRRPDAWGYELGYLGIYGMGGTRVLSGAENLQLAGPLASLVPLPYAAADQVTASYTSMFQSAEFNIFKGCCGDPCGNGPSACPDCCIDWLGGFRYANLNEQAGLAFTCCTTAPTGPFTSSYDVQTSNNLFGGQFGGRASRWWGNWGLEGWAKAGMFANVQTQTQDPIIDPANPGTPVRGARATSGVEPAMIADLNLSVAYRFTNRLQMRVGYNALWVGNVALAPEQWDFGTSPQSGTALSGNGGLFLNGVNLGLEAGW